jgi:hypothetical protein
MSTFATPSSQSKNPQRKPAKAKPKPQLQPYRLAGLGSQFPVTMPVLQPKLKIGQLGDRYEQEADLIADQIMRMPEPYVQRQMESEEEEMVQRKAIANQVAPLEQQRESSEVPSIVHEVLRSPGQPLDPVTRAFMEPRFGHDFSWVRVHSGAAAEQSARDVNAHAYTVGHDIVFGAGVFTSGTHEGRRLIAHELTHVVQQSGADGIRIDQGGNNRGLFPQVGSSNLKLNRFGESEHKKLGNRATTKFPYFATLATDEVALRSSPKGRRTDNQFHNLVASLRRDVRLLVVGNAGKWMRVIVQSGTALDGTTNKPIDAAGLTGYVSEELLVKESGVFDQELPVLPGLTLTYGDFTALGGDHFKRFKDLDDKAKSPGGTAKIKQFVDVVEGRKKGEFEDPKTIDAEWAERYKNLALDNVSHFSHGGTALTTWQEMHRDAIIDAFEAGKKGDSTGLAKAYALNGFADHFLTDSFSSGHVRVPRESMIIYYKKFARDVFQHIIDYVSDRLGTRIYELLRQDYRRVRLLGDEGDRQKTVARIRAQIVQAITNAGGPAKVQETFGLYVAGAISKILHDLENKQGLNVVSKKHPEGWTAFGDGLLDIPGNAKNLAFVTEAVQASKQDLLNAFGIGLDVLTQHGKTPPKAAIDAAMADVTKKVGPPYAALEFVPSPAPGVKPLPSWEWGNLDKTMQTKLLAVIAKYLTTTAQTELLEQFPPRQEIEINGPNVDARPRDAARDILNEFLADPVRFLEQAFGRAAAP